MWGLHRHDTLTYMNSGDASVAILGSSLAWTFTITEEVP